MRHHNTLPALMGCALASLPIVLAADEQDERALRVEALYTAEIWRNVQGGLRTGAKLLGDLDIAAEIDGERAWGLEGVTLFANGLFVHGGSLSGQYVGDAQTLSNIEAARQARLFELWFEKRFGAERTGHSLRVGLYDLNSEFDSSDTSSLFVNSSHGIGPQIAQTGLNGPSIFPVTSLGARLRWTIAPAWSAQVAALDGVPGHPDRPASNDIDLGSRDGLLLVAEVARENGSQGPRLKKVALGAWGYTARFDDISSAEDSEPAQRRGNNGVYALLDAQVFSEQDDPDQGLSAFLRVGTADEHVNRFADYIGAGLVYTGALSWRPEDQLGIAVASAGNGRPYRLVNERNGVRTASREHAVELTYRFGVTSWLTLQGELQHIVNPDTNPLIADATVIGLRFELTKSL
jgi:porin